VGTPACLLVQIDGLERHPMTTLQIITPTTPTVVRTVAGLRDAVAALRTAGRSIALVPTMGALHDGHLSLLRLAGHGDHAVVMSLFVNPTQFAPTEDLSAYPRDEGRDLRLAAQAGAELVFAPDASEIYSDGFGTTITVDGPTRMLEGAARPDHFAGVATVVAKLLIAARPDRAVFGQKDAQQVAVIRRLIRDLHLDDIELVVGPIVREPDGLAMSSRNAYLGPQDRTAALVLRRALDAAVDAVDAGVDDPRHLEQIALDVLSAEPRCTPEYARIVHPDTFAFANHLDGPALMCVCGRVGPARLIDNQFLKPA
jgi:pantoate--beta-alanine ligase